MKPQKNLYDTLKEINDIESSKERKEALKGAESFELKGLLQAAFDDRVQFDLPEGAPPISEDDINIRPFRNVIRVLPRLVKNNGIAAIRKEMLFVKSVLQTQPKNMRDLLVAMKDKKLDTLFPNINTKLVKAVFPDIVV